MLNFNFTSSSNKNEEAREKEENELLEALEGKIEGEEEKKKWIPKEWKLEYEKIVLMHLGGASGVEIARKLGCTPQHVYNILGTPQAIAIEAQLIEKVREKTFNMEEELVEIEKLTVRRLSKMLKDDDTFEKYPISLISKGMDIMKGRGEYLKGNVQQQTNNFFLPPSVAENLIEGLNKANLVRELNQKEMKQIPEATIVNE